MRMTRKQKKIGPLKVRDQGPYITGRNVVKCGKRSEQRKGKGEIECSLIYSLHEKESDGKTIQ
jgi:hypothetical protein